MCLSFHGKIMTRSRRSIVYNFRIHLAYDTPEDGLSNSQFVRSFPLSWFEQSGAMQRSCGDTLCAWLRPELSRLAIWWKSSLLSPAPCNAVLACGGRMVVAGNSYVLTHCAPRVCAWIWRTGSMADPVSLPPTGRGFFSAPS